MKSIIAYFLLLITTISNAQTTINGQITDTKSEPLAFVNMIVNNDNRRGQITDIDGLFSIENVKVGDKLYLSYLGYEPLIYTITKADFSKKITIQMQTASFQLEEIAVIAGENPAHRIIKKVIKNRNQNNPEKYDKFRCETYNKMLISELIDYEKYQSEVIDKRQDTLTEEQRRRDEAMQKSQKSSSKYYTMIMETVTDKQFIAPNSHKEVVLHNKVSGFKRPEFVALAKDMQPFAFYEPQLQILGKTYLNPISRGSTKIYFFDWTDTLINGQDSTFIIEFRPKAGKTFNGLKGVLYIHSNQYAIQNIIAEPADMTLAEVRIEQKYTFYSDVKKWFPEQLNVEWMIKNYPSLYRGFLVQGKSYIRKVALNPDIRKREFTRDKYIMADDVFDLDTTGWKSERTDVLTRKEIETYHFMDSISEKNNLEGAMNAAYSIFDTKLSLGKIDLDLDRILAINDYEKARLGIGFQTNDDLVKNVSVGGYFGYGFGDKAIKYGGNFTWNISKKYDINLKIGYQNDLLVPGALNLPVWQVPFSRTTENIYQPMLDNLEAFYGEFQSDFLKYGNVDIRYAQQEITSNSGYEYTTDDDVFNQFSFQELSLGLRYAFGEQTVTFMGLEMPEPTKFPILKIRFTVGNWLETNTTYQKIQLGVNQKIELHRLGSFEYNVEAGMINGELPWTKLFNSRGLGVGFQPVIIENTFKTMNPNEYLSSEFLHLFLRYRIGTLTKSSEFFQPELSIVHNQAWGSLNNKLNHSQEFKTLENGFFESGIELNNLYRHNYLNFAYLGIGAGIYYNHTDWNFENLNSKLSYNLLLTFDF